MSCVSTPNYLKNLKLLELSSLLNKIASPTEYRIYSSCSTRIIRLSWFKGSINSFKKYKRGLGSIDEYGRTSIKYMYTLKLDKLCFWKKFGFVEN